MSKRMKKLLLFVPVWMCLLSLSTIRTFFCLPKVKSPLQKRAIGRINKLCQRLYSIVKPPFRIGYGSLLVPPYYREREIHHGNGNELEKIHEQISKKRAANADRQAQ